MSRIVAILDRMAKSGTNAKGQWSMAQVKLDNNREIFIFNPINVGDEVEPHQTERDGKTFTNWRVKEESSSDKLLKAIYEQNKQILSLLGANTQDSSQNKPQGPVNALENQKKVDEVFDVPDEEINFDGIPF